MALSSSFGILVVVVVFVLFVVVVILVLVCGFPGLHAYWCPLRGIAIGLFVDLFGSIQAMRPEICTVV